MDLLMGCLLFCQFHFFIQIFSRLIGFTQQIWASLQIFLGNLFNAVLYKYPGNNKKDRCNGLFADINQYYKDNQITSRLDNLYPTMIQQDGKQPKLRGKAAECRFLVPFAKSLVINHFSDLDPYEKTIKQAAFALNKCYDCLSAARFSAPVLARSSKEFALFSCALETHVDGKLWRV